MISIMLVFRKNYGQNAIRNQAGPSKSIVIPKSVDFAQFMQSTMFIFRLFSLCAHSDASFQNVSANDPTPFEIIDATLSTC